MMGATSIGKIVGGQLTKKLLLGVTKQIVVHIYISS